MQERREIRMSRFNLYLELFNVVIVNNMDLLECVPNLSLLWDNPWGNMVTLKVTCYQTQYLALLGVLQYALDLLMHN